MTAHEHLSNEQLHEQGREQLRKKFTDIGLEPVTDPNTGTMWVEIGKDHPLLKSMSQHWEDSHE